MRSFFIDDSFIIKWHPRYEETEDDEEEYRQIVASAKEEIRRTGNLSKETFIRILDWKAPRLKGIVRLNNFKLYAEAIKKSLGAPEGQKLIILDNLYGIGAPLASTILHFIYPEKFPIIDIRTVEVLYARGYVKSKLRDARRYPDFKAAILLIRQQFPKWTLRQIDRALFAFHKLTMSLTCKHPKG